MALPASARRVVAIGIALAACAIAPPAFATLIRHNLQFGAFDQSPFQPGSTYTKSDSFLAGPSWNTPLSPGDIPPIGPLYITPTLQTQGRFGAEFGYAVSGGGLDLKYPVSAAINVPDSVRAGTPFAVNSNVGVNPAGFSTAQATLDANPLLSPWVSIVRPGERPYLGPRLETEFPQAVAYLDLVAQLENRISASATYPVPVLGIPPWETKTDNVLDIKLPGFDVRMPVFELSKSGIQTAIPGASLNFGTKIPILSNPTTGSNILTTTFNYPDLATSTTSLSGTSLLTGGQQTVVGLEMNVLQLLALGFPILSGLEGRIPLGIGEIDYNLLRLTAGLDLNLRQSFAFSATPTAFLYFDTPASVVSGDSWSAPSNLIPLPAAGELQLAFANGRGGGPIDAQLSYALFNQLTQETSLVLSGNLKATALEANLKLDLGFVEIDEGFGPLFGPLGPEGDLVSFKICCDAPSFEVKVTPVVTKPFEIQVESAPRTARPKFLAHLADGSAIYEIQEFAGNEFPGDKLNLRGREFLDVGLGVVFLADLDVVFDGRNYGRLFCVSCVEVNPDPLLVSSAFAIDGGGTAYVNDFLMDLFSPPAGPPCESCLDAVLSAHSLALDGAGNDVQILLNRLPEIFPIESLPGAQVPTPGTPWLVALALVLLAATRRPRRAAAGR